MTQSLATADVVYYKQATHGGDMAKPLGIDPEGFCAIWRCLLQQNGQDQSVPFIKKDPGQISRIHKVKWFITNIIIDYITIIIPEAGKLL
jgi:hypothetical protein